MKSDGVGSRDWNNQMFLKHPTPYDGIPGLIQKHRIRTIIKHIEKYTDNNSLNILEIGCGAGNVLARVVEEFPDSEVAGVDISDEALQTAETKLPDGVSLEHHNIAEEPVDRAFDNVDVIIVTEVLEHIPDAQAAVENISASVSGNSLVIITVPIEKYKLKIKRALVFLKVFHLFFENIEEGSSEWHYHDFSKEDMMTMCTPYFRILEHGTICLMHRILVAQKRQ